MKTERVIEIIDEMIYDLKDWQNASGIESFATRGKYIAAIEVLKVLKQRIENERENDDN
jgi:hypothetical protein